MGSVWQPSTQRERHDQRSHRHDEHQHDEHRYDEHGHDRRRDDRGDGEHEGRGGRRGWAIRGTGAYLPARRVPSREVSRSLGLDPSWIEDRTGIRHRHVAEPGQAASDLAAHAARDALDDAGLDARDIGLIVLGTSTPDELGPSTACRVQARLGADRAAAFDVAAACTGFLFGLSAAVGWLSARPEPAPYALVIGVEVYSRFLDPGDRATAALFGDGAAAAVIGPVPAPYGIGPVTIGSDGTRAGDVLIPAGGSRRPASAETLEGRGHTIHMDGRAVRAFIAEAFPRLVAEAAEDAGVKPADLALVVPHQPNPRLVESLAGEAGLEPAQLAIIGWDVGNIGAASIPYALHRSRHRISAGDLVLLAGFGAGVTWGRALITWPPNRPRTRPGRRAGSGAVGGGGEVGCGELGGDGGGAAHQRGQGA